MKTLIKITTTKEEYKKQYSFRARVGVMILRILQVVHIVWEEKKEELILEKVAENK